MKPFVGIRPAFTPREGGEPDRLCDVSGAFGPRPHRLSVRTPAFQAGEAGSIPAGDATSSIHRSVGFVGAATGEPLGDEYEAFQKPLRERGFDPRKIFYLAESVLDPAYRGQGVGHRFFDEREAHARRLGFGEAMFCGVIRPEDHPMRPADYRPLDPFWKKRGYGKLDGVIVTFPWQDIGDTAETEKPMQVWYRKF